MVIAYVGKDHRGTLLQDSMDYFNSAIGAPSSSTAAASSGLSSLYSGQAGNYIQQSQPGLGSGSGATLAPSSVGNSNDTTASGTQLASGFPDPLDQKQVEQYILQKYQEGYSMGLHKPANG